MALRWQDIPEPRSNIIHLRPRTAPASEALHALREQSKTHHPSRVSLSQTEAELIASMLRSVRHLVPSPKGVDAAIELLVGRDAS